MSQKTDFSKLSAPYLSFEQIQDSVNEINSKLEISTIPIDPELISEKMGISIVPISHLFEKYSVEALLIYKKKEILIDLGHYEDDRYWFRSKFSLAHKLGHYVLHSQLYEKVTFSEISDWIEFQKETPEHVIDRLEFHANEFAGRLLVPCSVLIKDVQQWFDLCSFKFGKSNELEHFEEVVHALSRKFEVSAQVIEVRLRKEKVLEKLLS